MLPFKLNRYFVISSIMILINVRIWAGGGRGKAYTTVSQHKNCICSSGPVDYKVA